MLRWLLTDPYWLATQGIIQNSTILFWTAAGWGMAKVHAHLRLHNANHRRLLEEIHAKVHEGGR